MNKKHYFKYIICTILILILCTWYIPSFSRGIDLSDTCFSLIKYKYIFDSEHAILAFTTCFSDIAGGIIYHMAPSYQLLRLNLASAIITLIGSFVLIYKFRKELSLPLALIVLFASHLFTFSTLHIFNYNTTSIFIMIIAFCSLVSAIQRNNNKLLLLSGFICGINTFFRFPNILHCGMIVGILWYEIICCKHTIKMGITRALRYFIGILLSFITGGILCVLFLGPAKVWSAITSTFNKFFVPSDSNTHSGSSMLASLFDNLTSSIQAWWIIGIVLIMLFCIVILLSKKNMITKQSSVVKLLAAFIGIGLGLISFYIMYRNILTTTTSASGETYHMWIIFIFISCITSIYGAISYRQTNPYLSTICILNIILILILPFGTDVGFLYYSHYCSVANIITLLVLAQTTKTEKKPGVLLAPFLVSFILCYSFTMGGYYQSIYVYRDSSPEELTASVDIPELYGMRTSEFRAYSITYLSELLEPYSEYDIITLGDNNILPVVTDMPCFFSSPWPDLSSFKEEKFMSELETNIADGNLPVIVFSSKTARKTDGEYPYRSASKYLALVDVIKNNHYQTLYSNQYYQIYVPTMQ